MVTSGRLLALEDILEVVTEVVGAVSVATKALLPVTLQSERTVPYDTVCNEGMLSV